jgi:hypothetical protein
MKLYTDLFSVTVLRLLNQKQCSITELRLETEKVLDVKLPHSLFYNRLWYMKKRGYITVTRCINKKRVYYIYGVTGKGVKKLMTDAELLSRVYGFLVT